MGSGRSWIRIDEGGGLLALTQAYHLPIEEKLGWLMHNTAIGLADFQHVEGVVISHGAEPDWNPMANLAGVTERVSGSAVIERRLPGGRRRRTYLVRLDRVGSCSHVISCWIRKLVRRRRSLAGLGVELPRQAIDPDLGPRRVTP